MCGVALVRSAPMNDIHSSSTHMGSFPSFAGFVGTHVHPFVPARSVTALPFCHSSIVAFSEMKLGAAVSALAIFCASVHCACPRTRLDDIAAATTSTTQPTLHCP